MPRKPVQLLPISHHIRWMIRRDLPGVLGIENDSFPQPWNEADFLTCLRQRNCIEMVDDVGDRVLGYMIYQLHKDYLYVLNFAAHAAFRRRGVGRAMAKKLIGKLSSHRRTRIVLHVREGNLSAQLFFRACGFAATNVVRGRYGDTDEDGYRFAYRLPANPIDEPIHSGALPEKG